MTSLMIFVLSAMNDRNSKFLSIITPVSSSWEILECPKSYRLRYSLPACLPAVASSPEFSGCYVPESTYVCHQFRPNEYSFSPPFPSFLAIFCLKLHVHIYKKFPKKSKRQQVFLATPPHLLSKYVLCSKLQLTINKYIRCHDRCYSSCCDHLYHHVSIDLIKLLYKFIYCDFMYRMDWDVSSLLLTLTTYRSVNHVWF